MNYLFEITDSLTLLTEEEKTSTEVRGKKERKKHAIHNQNLPVMNCRD